MNGFREKCEKPKFLAFWPKMANFGQFLAKMCETGFFQKPLGTFFPPFWVLTNCKVSEKKLWMIVIKLDHGWTDGSQNDDT